MDHTYHRAPYANRPAIAAAAVTYNKNNDIASKYKNTFLIAGVVMISHPSASTHIENIVVIFFILFVWCR